jgi:hypothetical protein
MPYSSKKQAAFMHIHHPRIAAKWDREGSKVEEMPHFSDGESGDGSDLQVEKWPISSDEKKAVMNLIKTTDVAGDLGRGAWQIFGKDGTTRRGGAEDVKNMPVLPSVWKKFYVHETVDYPSSECFEPQDSDFLQLIASIIGDGGIDFDPSSDDEDESDDDADDEIFFGGDEDGN